MNEIKIMLCCLIIMVFGIGIKNEIYCYMGFIAFLIWSLIKVFRKEE